MKTCSISLLSITVLCTAGLTSLSAADLTGKVKLKGTPPPEAPIPLDANCGKVQTKPITTRHYIVGSDSGLGNVFVYLKQGAAAKKSDGPAPTVLDQMGCEYQPYVLGMVAGQKLTIRNSDPFMHNVHSLAVNNTQFNIAQTSKGVEHQKIFDKPEVLAKLKCDVHPWMFAYVGVVEHPYFAVTDKDGSFKIGNVPAGEYTVEALHLKAGSSTQKVKVGDADQKPLDFTLEVKPKA